MGFIPTLAAAVHLLCILSTVVRTGINPVPTADVCNTLVIKGLPKCLQHTVTKSHNGLDYRAERWFFINKEGNSIVRTMQLPLP